MATIMHCMYTCRDNFFIVLYSLSADRTLTGSVIINYKYYILINSITTTIQCNEYL